MHVGENHSICVFFFNDTATTEIYTLSLHDALPIFIQGSADSPSGTTVALPTTITNAGVVTLDSVGGAFNAALDRKSTRLNSSHANISYAVFCLKKKTKISNNYSILHKYYTISNSLM